MSDTTQTPKTALCPQCGQSFTARGNKRFCQPKCQARFNNRMAAEGKLLAPLVKAMMATRGGGGRKVPQICGMARSELTRIARELNDADAKAGRPPIHHYVAALFETCTLYMDRRRVRKPEEWRPAELIEVPGGPFLSEDDAIDRGWPAMHAYCRERGYSLSGAGANPDKDRPGTFKLNGAHVTGGNNKRLRRSHCLVARGVGILTGRRRKSDWVIGKEVALDAMRDGAQPVPLSDLVNPLGQRYETVMSGATVPVVTIVNPVANATS